MSPENEPSDIEETLEKFRGDLDAACEFATGFGARTPLQDLPTFDELVGHESEMMQALYDYFGVDVVNQEAVAEYIIQGTPGTPGEGEINVSVIETDCPGVFLGIYAHPTTGIDWAIRPLEVEE